MSKTTKLSLDERAAWTTKIARAMIGAEATSREAKSAKLRDARLAQELPSIMAELQLKAGSTTIERVQCDVVHKGASHRVVIPK